uniref:Uncharacterized protein n=1 Tax=Mycena chlorophos TaxID=658473 RepID=A0ABQ0M012_MYCCL|nr:predicted protein [Mycena chlorophos]
MLSSTRDRCYWRHNMAEIVQQYLAAASSALVIPRVPVRVIFSSEFSESSSERGKRANKTIAFRAIASAKLHLRLLSKHPNRAAFTFPRQSNSEHNGDATRISISSLNHHHTMGSTGRNGKKGVWGFKYAPHTHPSKGEPLRLHKSSRRTLESWANHFGFKHLADELPMSERAEFYREKLKETQRQGLGPFVGQKMKRLSMAESDWPNKPFRERQREVEEYGELHVRDHERHQDKAFRSLAS